MQIGDAQPLFAWLNSQVTQTIDNVGYILKSDSLILGKNLEQAGYERNDNEAAHHIVAAADPRAENARLILQKAGLDINSAFNGVFLNAVYHAGIHTDTYYEVVDVIMEGATTFSQVATRLSLIRGMLLSGTMPH